MLSNACKNHVEKVNSATDKGGGRPYTSLIRIRDARKDNPNGRFSYVDTSLSQNSDSAVFVTME
eukprot:snap_masked-scaffold_1-processed-gene-22.28-mRNA-1 protein AED:1.00 eAED:1.00 QI:0/-1/0/0/-1/1/1/0/63